MKSHLIFIACFILSAGINANAQSRKLKYLLIEVYADSSFMKLDTLKHNVGVYSIKKKKEVITPLPQQIFCLQKNKGVKNIVVKINNREFDISTAKVRSKFAVLKIYINENLINNTANLLVKSGDVIYKLTSCTECHKIELTQLSIIINSDGSPTTRYKVLDDYLLK